MTDKLEGIKPGDRVRITIEGVVQNDDDLNPIKVLLDGWDIASPLHHKAVSAPTFQIERIEPPLKVGDRVRHKGTSMANTAVVKLINGQAACVLWDYGSLGIDQVSDLERIA